MDDKPRRVSTTEGKKATDNSANNDVHTFCSIDTVGDNDNPCMFPPEFLNSLSLPGLAEHELNLKVNTIVILMRTMDIEGGHCKGTRYLVKHIGQHILRLHKLDARGDGKNKLLVLPRITMRYEGGGIPFELKRLQFPIEIASPTHSNGEDSSNNSGNNDKHDNPNQHQQKFAKEQLKDVGPKHGGGSFVTFNAPRGSKFEEEHEEKESDSDPSSDYVLSDSN